jgi:hypothetical protein
MSIKKKFATAVATAGLLAGLFGSALVPSALAGNVDSSAAAFKASYTSIVTTSEDYDADPQYRDMARSGTSKVFGFPSDWSYGTSINPWTAIGVLLEKSDHSTLDLSATGFDTLILKAVSSNSNVRLAWAYDDNGAEQACDDSDVEANLGASSSYVDIAPADMTDSPYNASDGYWLCFAAKKDTTAATSTITVSVGGVTATTFTMTAVGPIATVSVALNDGKYLAGGNNQIDDWATVIAKDAAGVVINGADNSISPSFDDMVYVEDGEEQVDNAAGDSIDAANDSYLDSDGKTHESYNQMQINSDVCNSADAYGEDGDEGKSYSLMFRAADYYTNDDYVDSNSVSITCTGDASGAKVTKVVGEVTSGDTDYVNAVTEATDFAINATIVDADGRPLGNGAGSLSYHGMDFAFKAGIASCLHDATTGWSTVAIDGVAEIGTLAPEGCTPGKKSYSVVVANSDLAVSGAGDDPVSKTFVNSYTAAFAGHDGDISKTRNKAKTRATITADFGEDASYGKVTFTVTTANGVDQIFTRNANGEGVATLVLNRRNTRVYVFADAVDFGDVFVGSTGIIAIRFR